MALQTHLARVRGLGSAKEGTHHWWAQRVTAIALVPLTIWFAISVTMMVDADYQAVIAWVASPLTTVFLLLLVLATFQHLYLGMQVVLEDYIHHEGVKIICILLVKYISFILAITCIYAVLKISFGDM